MSEEIRKRLDAIDARFDQRYNDRKVVTAALRAVLDLCDRRDPGIWTQKDTLNVADVRNVVAEKLGVTP